MLVRVPAAPLYCQEMYLLFGWVSRAGNPVESFFIGKLSENNVYQKSILTHTHAFIFLVVKLLSVSLDVGRKGFKASLDAEFKGRSKLKDDNEINIILFFFHR